MRSVWGWKKDSYVSHVDRGAGQCGRYGLRESDPRMTELLSTRGGGTTMKKIQILGTGCSKCNNLTANAETAAREAGIPYEVVKITDINEIINYGVMLTPALAVDGQVKLVGRVPSVTEMKQLLTQA
jgi:small redox-active disulfide protein 2